MPPDGLAPASRIAAGTSHSVVLLADGDVLCWGSNLAGESTVPPLPAPVQEIAAGFSHTVALLNNGNVVTWGSNPFAPPTPPGSVAAGRIEHIACGTWQTIALHMPCSESPTGPAECPCGEIALDSNEDGVADCVQYRRGDLNIDGAVNARDLVTLLALWGTADPPFGDLNNDGAIGAPDMVVLLGNWGNEL
jgi:alpha-tubulin suppressor-like RCC1 family protein